MSKEVWELVTEDRIDCISKHHGGMMGEAVLRTERLKIPKGWLYRSREGATVHALVFVPERVP